MPPEQRVIDKIVAYVESVGGLCIKFHATGMSRSGIPDLICTMPQVGTFFVETKAPGETPRPLQVAVMDEINKAGGFAFWTDSFEKFLDILGTICHSIKR